MEIRIGTLASYEKAQMQLLPSVSLVIYRHGHTHYNIQFAFLMWAIDIVIFRKQLKF